MECSHEYDIIIIGAGALGCAVARELSRYSVSVAVLEKNRDVAGETSGRNSAVVHSGIYSKTGTLMAEFCTRGNQEFEALCRELDVPFKKTGKLIVAEDEIGERGIEALYEQGKDNGCSGIEIISGNEAAKLVKGVKATKALYSPETGIVNPFLYCIGLAESAHENGVGFHFGSKVKSIKRRDDIFEIEAGERIYRSRIIVNCAGLYADDISMMAGGRSYDIYPCRGEYFVLDEDRENILPMPVYPAPREGIGGLGIHITPTAEGNILLGPSAVYINEKDDYSVTEDVMKGLMEEAHLLMPRLASLKPIGNYSGIRPKLTSPEKGGYDDFVIEEDSRVEGLFNMVGIESPGLTASVPAARYIAGMIGKKIKLTKKDNCKVRRRGAVRFRDQSEHVKAKLIADNPEYGEIVCRCRSITKAEIRAAIENPLGVRTLSGIKYRAWATTGRCNGGYCMPRIVSILLEEYGIEAEEILYRDEGSNMFTGEVK